MSRRVAHCKKDRYDVYIGRPSKWGNPFIIGRDGDRVEVIAKYREWIMAQSELLGAIWNGELRGMVLGCWCAPFACHGDVLVELDEEVLQAAAGNEQAKKEWLAWKTNGSQ